MFTSSWLWSNRAWKVSLGCVPRLRYLRIWWYTFNRTLEKTNSYQIQHKFLNFFQVRRFQVQTQIFSFINSNVPFSNFILKKNVQFQIQTFQFQIQTEHSISTNQLQLFNLKSNFSFSPWERGEESRSRIPPLIKIVRFGHRQHLHQDLHDLGSDGQHLRLEHETIGQGFQDAHLMRRLAIGIGGTLDADTGT